MPYAQGPTVEVSIVIPSWRGRQLLETYLPSVFAAAESFHNVSGHQTEIVIVEDAGGDDTAEWLQKTWRDRVRLINHPENLGFCAACQTGFEESRGRLILLLNNDVRLNSDCIAPLVEHFRDPAVFAVTGKLLSQKGDQFCNGGKVARFRRGMWSTYENYDLKAGGGVEQPLFSFTAIGAFSAYDRSKLLETGGFDPLTAMVEDVELSYRGWKRGWTILYEPRSIAYHDASQTMDRRYKRRSLDKISRRSRILMHWMLLQEPGMFARHVTSIAGRFLVSWLILDWRFYWAVFTGLQNLSSIRRKRRETRRTMKRTDGEILRMLETFYCTAPIELRRPWSPVRPDEVASQQPAYEGR
jgi:O-antigen biosynthesis protein